MSEPIHVVTSIHHNYNNKTVISTIQYHHPLSTRTTLENKSSNTSSTMQHIATTTACHAPRTTHHALILSAWHDMTSPLCSSHVCKQTKWQYTFSSTYSLLFSDLRTYAWGDMDKVSLKIWPFLVAEGPRHLRVLTAWLLALPNGRINQGLLFDLIFSR